MECIGGRVSNAEIKETKTGKQFLAFSVAENKGFGESKVTTWYDCTSWDTGLSVQKGSQVIVFGHSSVKEYKDKTYNQVEVFHVEVLQEREKTAAAPVSKHVVHSKKQANGEEIPF